MAGSGRKSFLEGREVLPENREWSGGPLGGPGVVEGAIPEGRGWSVGPPRGQRVVGRHSWKDGRPF